MNNKLTDFNLPNLRIKLLPNSISPYYFYHYKPKFDINEHNNIEPMNDNTYRQTLSCGTIIYFKYYLSCIKHLHREDGPAVETLNGSKEYWLNGKEYSKEDFEKIIKLKAFW